jgi:hypothetical protein
MIRFMYSVFSETVDVLIELDSFMFNRVLSFGLTSDRLLVREMNVFLRNGGDIASKRMLFEGLESSESEQEEAPDEEQGLDLSE